MTCMVCRGILQVALNLAELLDVMGNTLLLGSPQETVSRRVARARASGERWAAVACRGLSVLFWFMRRDHCTWALTPGVIAKEVWHWSPPDEG